MKIIALSGSLRKDSFTVKILKELGRLAPEGYELEIVEIGHLPFINQDLEADLPQSIVDFKNKVKEADAFIFGTPEYNRSFSPVLKNALDWGSRPYVENVWGQKPGAVVTSSPSNLAGFGANHHLRQVLMFLNVYTLQQPEFYMPHVHQKFNDEGQITDEQTLQIIENFWNAYKAWIENFKK